MRIISLALLTAPALAFVAPAARVSRDVRMSAEKKAQPMGAVARGLAAATTLLSIPLAGLPNAAFASAGDSPKISVFGLGGGKADLSSPFVEDTATFSPYSPYGTGSDALFKPLSPDAVARAKREVTVAQKRITSVEGLLAKGKWDFVRSELTAQGEDLRKSVEVLSAAKGSPEATQAGKNFLKSIEDIQVAAAKKDLAAAKSAYAEAKVTIDSFAKSAF